MRKGFFNLAIAAIAVGIGISLSMRPWRVYAQQKTSTNQQVLEMKRVETERVRDLQQEASLGSSAGREQLARERGYHRVGEVSPDGP